MNFLAKSVITLVCSAFIFNPVLAADQKKIEAERQEILQDKSLSAAEKQELLNELEHMQENEQKVKQMQKMFDASGLETTKEHVFFD